MLYKKPSYVAEFGIGDEVSWLCKIVSLTSLCSTAFVCDSSNIYSPKTKQECLFTMECGHHCSHWELALACELRCCIRMHEDTCIHLVH